jgi:MSHA biogenesis protein MshK
MDKAVKLAALAAMLAAGALAQAQALSDPTRPPPMMLKAPPGTAAAAPAGPVLQSVLIGRQAGGRQVAVIDGETVRLGGAFRGAVLVRMTETEVELRRGQERQVLKLFAAAGSTTIARSK